MRVALHKSRRTLGHRATLQAAAAILLSTATPGFALTTAEIVASTLSPDCLEYRVVGICYWLYCSRSGCRIRTSIKVRHYVPDAVVSSYANTGENPWLEVRPMSLPNPTAQGGNDGTTNQAHENNLLKFKNADAIGHPGTAAFQQMTSGLGYFCQGAGTPFMPYLLSTLDTVAWRYGMPESLYPESLTPGICIQVSSHIEAVFLFTERKTTHGNTSSALLSRTGRRTAFHPRRRAHVHRTIAVFAQYQRTRRTPRFPTVRA